MESPDVNKENQFVKFIEEGKDVGNAVKPKEIIDVRAALKAKYPDALMPDPSRIIRTVSSNQQRGVKRE